LALNNLELRLVTLRVAANDASRVAGLTHPFYRYPARFSPAFAAAAIEAFSGPGDLVLDPFSGGGTTVVEALAAGRTAVGSDLNELATFVSRVKTLKLSETARDTVAVWTSEVVPTLRYNLPLTNRCRSPASGKNLTGASARVIRKLTAVALERLPAEGGEDACLLARGAVLSTAQWALDGRRTLPHASAFRERLASTVSGLVEGLSQLWERAANRGNATGPCLATLDVVDVGSLPPFREGRKADLVIMSPPYPGVHVLYHRWQVSGGQETPAPYWIAASRDGQGAAFYTMGARNSLKDDVYFSRLFPRLRAVRSVMREGAFLVQIVGFADPQRQLRRYLRLLDAAGFSEVRRQSERRIWRQVPGRKWHAVQRDTAPASKEVVLVHRAR
jgi:DNA modification methylase